MKWTDLIYQLPAVFTAVPMVHRLLPFKLAARAIPLFYFIVALVVMALPSSVCVALGAAGLVSMLHIRLGENLANAEPPDMSEVMNKLALAWDHMVISLPRFLIVPVNGKVPETAMIHDDSEDDNPVFAEPPSPPEGKIPQRIPHLG